MLVFTLSMLFTAACDHGKAVTTWLCDSLFSKAQQSDRGEILNFYPLLHSLGAPVPSAGNTGQQRSLHHTYSVQTKVLRHKMQCSQSLFFFWFGSVGHTFHTQHAAPSEGAGWLKQTCCRAWHCGKTTKYY